MPRKKQIARKQKTKLTESLVDFFLYGPDNADKSTVLDFYFIKEDEAKKLWQENKEVLIKIANERNVPEKKIWAVIYYKKERQHDISEA